MWLRSSYNTGFAPRDGTPRYPQLWAEERGVWPTSLGPGGVLRNLSRRQAPHATFSGTTAPSWSRQHGHSMLNYAGAPSISNLDVLPTTLDPGEVTISLWFSATSVASTQMLFSDTRSDSSRTMNIELGRTSGKISMRQNGAGVLYYSTGSIVANTLYHLLVVKRGATGDWYWDLYINGILDSSQSDTSNPNTPTSTQYTTLGYNAAFANLPFTGYIGDVIVYRGNQSRLVGLLSSRMGVAHELETRRAYKTPEATSNRRRRLLTGSI